VRKLLQDGAHPDERDAQGCTALHWAADKGHPNIITTLIQAGASIDAVDGDGMTPLHYAALAEQRAAAETLLHAGADALAPAIDGSTSQELGPGSWGSLFSTCKNS